MPKILVRRPSFLKIPWLIRITRMGLLSTVSWKSITVWKLPIIQPKLLPFIG
jgi:hypothetical protein